jgi:hypothetical protein
LLKILFSELSNLSKQTALLESLDWSEEKLDDVFKICSESILEMMNSPSRFSSPDQFREKIFQDLSGVLTEDQTKSVLDILNNVISQSLEGIMTDGN